jgi:hypothetical protein
MWSDSLSLYGALQPPPVHFQRLRRRVAPMLTWKSRGITSISIARAIHQESHPGNSKIAQGLWYSLPLHSPSSGKHQLIEIKDYYLCARSQQSREFNMSHQHLLSIHWFPKDLWRYLRCSGIIQILRRRLGETKSESPESYSNLSHSKFCNMAWGWIWLCRADSSPNNSRTSLGRKLQSYQIRRYMCLCWWPFSTWVKVRMLSVQSM